MAQPAFAASLRQLASLLPDLGGLPASPSGGGPFGLPSRSESVIRGAVCGSSARTDLRGAGRSNSPGLPDNPRGRSAGVPLLGK